MMEMNVNKTKPVGSNFSNSADSSVHTCCTVIILWPPYQPQGAVTFHSVFVIYTREQKHKTEFEHM